jgi:ribosomal protein S18 acetylase RimI-like enzyme
MKRENEIVIRAATSADVPQLGKLFDLYRQFYEQPADRALAQGYIADRLAKNESVILVAHRPNSGLLGFTQLYPTFCSVAAAPIYVLYDLFVEPSARGSGVGRALMLVAQAFAAEKHVARLELSTARDNTTAQALYESLGWERDEKFFTYRWSVVPPSA